MKKSAFVFGLAFTLAACGGGAEEYDEPTEAELPDVAETTDDAGPEDAEPTGPNEAELEEDADAMARADAAIAADKIPVRFHGKWDAATGSCAPESDGRMEVSEKEISFYESVGDVTNVEDTGTGVKVNLAMDGEGEKWTAQYTLDLDGDQLKTTTEEGDTFARKRCP